jgi:hypothetical protein
MKSKASFIFLAIVFIECSLRAFEGDPFGKIKIVLKKNSPWTSGDSCMQIFSRYCPVAVEGDMFFEFQTAWYRW